MMRAVFVEGTAEEVADFAQRTGLVGASNGVSPEPDSVVDRFVRERTKGNIEKERLTQAYLADARKLGLRVQPGPTDKEGREKPYLTGRLTGPDENRVGNVIYLHPGPGRLEVRLPWDEVKGWVTHAHRPNSQRSPEVFAKVKHQVIIRLASDAAVTEAIKLTKQAMEYAATAAGER
jgi:hypothetical protein